MSRVRKFDPDRLAELRKLHAQGLNTAGIAEVMGEPYSTVRHVLRRGYQDDPPTPGRRHLPGRPSKFVGKTLRLLHRRREQGRSIAQLMAEFDAPRSVIYMALKRDPETGKLP